jgi:hypothetical protein
MLAVLLTLGLFGFFCIVGLAAQAALRVDTEDPRICLTAPILGSALIILPLFVLSNAGVPMQPGAIPVWIVLLIAAIVVLVWRRPRVALAAIPVVVLCLLDLAFLGRPLFQFGFDWLANANGDMGYYVLAATELLHHGLQTPVDFHALAEARDFPTSAQTLQLRGLRPGTQIGVAGLAAVTGRPPVSVYMPMSIAIAMCGACSTGALALQASRRWWAAAVAALLILVSPMAAYGVLQQLLPQDWGLGLIVALFAWLMRPELHRRASRSSLPDIVVISVLGAALFVVAYEVAASFALAYVFFLGLLLVRRQVSWRALVLLWGVPLGATAVILNTFLPRALRYLNDYVLNFGTSSGFKGLPQFGYAVVPTTVPGVAGVQRLFVGPQSPHMAAFIVVGALLLLGLLVAMTLTAIRGAAAGVTLVASLALGTMLARNGNQFGLFKLYMYIQPFIAATIAVFLARLRDRRAFAAVAAAIVVTIGLQLPNLIAYVDRSTNPVDLPHASSTDLLPAFREALDTARVPVVAVTDNFALEELDGAEAGSGRLYFLSRNIFDSSWKLRKLVIPTTTGSTRISFRENVGASRVLASGRCIVALPSGSQLALNRRSLPEGSPNLVIRHCGSFANILALVDSSKGQPATLPANRRAVSLWQLESDPSFRGQTFSGFGRYALFQVLDATQTVRLVLDFTTSPIQIPNGSFRLPPAAVVGTSRARFPVIGSGSARVISAPLRPMLIGGRPYVVLDMGRTGQFPLVPRPGITGLWGKSVLLDPRVLTSYVRDISVVSPAQYARLRAPSAIRSIPADLGNADLQYSGIFEDGWVGQTSYARLRGGPAGRLILRALVAPGTKAQRLRVLVNGRTVVARRTVAGSFELDVPIPASAAMRTVTLRWAQAARLSARDRRSVSALLKYLGVSQPPAAIRSPAGLADPGLTHSGIFKDGWLGKDARLVLAGGPAGTLVLHALVVTRGQRLEVRVDGRTVASRAVGLGEFTVRAPVPASSDARVIELHWTKDTRIAANDLRDAAALLRSISIGAP